MNQKKKIEFSHSNLAWGLTALIVICLSILFYLMLTKMPSIKTGWDKLIQVLMPVIIGIVMAYLLIPVYNALYVRIRPLLARSRLSEGKCESLSKGASTALSLLLLITIVSALLVMAGPQVLKSLIGIVDSLPQNIDKLTRWITAMLKDYPEILSMLTNLLNSFETSFLKIVTDYIMPTVNSLIGGITTGVISVVGFLFDLIVGFIVCIYVLNSKSVFVAQSKKFVYSIFSVDNANMIISDVNSIHRIFSGFISGKIIDSFIIGMISFVVLSIMNMPYAVMVSVIVGITNIIPFFGPFIGAIPSAIIILTEDPVKSLYFICYIIVIQQIDGNIIGPKILGNSTGLSSFWVLFSILVGGGLFGFAGMVLGVPVFATICMFVSKFVERNLRKRGLPEDSASYSGTLRVDPETGNFVDLTELKKKTYDNASDVSEMNTSYDEEKSSHSDMKEGRTDGSDH